jgi:hypothetical protein
VTALTTMTYCAEFKCNISYKGCIGRQQNHDEYDHCASGECEHGRQAKLLFPDFKRKRTKRQTPRRAAFVKALYSISGPPASVRRGTNKKSLSVAKEPMALIPCAECSTVFTPKFHNQKYCSDKCKKVSKARQTRESDRRLKGRGI